MIIIQRLWSLPNRPPTLSTHISNFDDIGQCWIFTPHFYAVFWQPFWKWQTSWKFWKHIIAPLMVTYHYVKFYVSIIIQLEVININVQNFPIGFYSNPHPLWTPKCWRRAYHALLAQLFIIRCLESYCFCSVYYYYYSSFFPWNMNLSTAVLRNYRTEFHETWWS
jgi:hypothetical protein